MIDVNTWIKTGMRAATDNAPVLLTAFGTVGVITTAVLTGKASYEAAKKIANEESVLNIKREASHERIHLSKTEKVKLVWPLYIGAVFSGGVTCTAIVLAHRISARRAAVLAAAYALNEGKLEEYQEKIKEKFGEKKEKEARDEIAQDQVNKLGDTGFAFANPLLGKQWIMEAYTGRPFLSTVEEVKHAVNQINAHINNPNERSARLSDFYDVLGLDHVSMSDYMGWTQADPLSIEWSTTTSPDGSLAVHVFEYVTHPVMNPEREASFL